MDGPNAWIDLLLLRAAELRAAGILEVSVGPSGCSACLAPLQVSVPVGEIAEPDHTVDNPVDPLHDGASYAGGVVPGFDIQPLDEE